MDYERLVKQTYSVYVHFPEDQSRDTRRKWHLSASNCFQTFSHFSHFTAAYFTQDSLPTLMTVDAVALYDAPAPESWFECARSTKSRRGPRKAASKGSKNDVSPLMSPRRSPPKSRALSPSHRRFRAPQNQPLISYATSSSSNPISSPRPVPPSRNAFDAEQLLPLEHGALYSRRVPMDEQYLQMLSKQVTPLTPAFSPACISSGHQGQFWVRLPFAD